MNKKVELLQGNIEKVIVGKAETITLLLTALLAKGHVLLEDMPGTGKTKLAKTLAASVSADFSRIQFTPDLLPTDVTGLNIYDRQKNDFVLRKGPIFTNILLADEINRATPRTQSGLLECMEEHQVTIDGKTYVLAAPFIVLATQNPIETAGTFPLPEAQMDRFMIKLSMGFPEAEEEKNILSRFMKEDPIDTLEAVMAPEELIEMQKEAEEIYVHQAVIDYIVAIVERTRNETKVVMGVSPRGSLALLRAAKAYAYLMGRDYVIPEDVKHLTVPVLAHRIVLSYGHQKGEDAKNMLNSMLSEIPVPTEAFDRR